MVKWSKIAWKVRVCPRFQINDFLSLSLPPTGGLFRLATFLTEIAPERTTLGAILNQYVDTDVTGSLDLQHHRVRVFLCRLPKLRSITPFQH